jgi:hypothetical protein
MCDKRKNSIGAFVLAGFVAVLMAMGLPGRGYGDPKPAVGVKESKRTVPSASGFIQRWLILEPTRATGDTQTAVQELVKAEKFAEQRSKFPSAGQKVTIDGAELTWHAVDTDEYNVNLHYFSAAVGKSADNALFWVAVNVVCPEEMKNVRLAAGANSAAVWWVNGQEVVGTYGNRPAVIDDGVSKRLTLKKGENTIVGAVMNASGAADFCARILDEDGKPVKGYTVSVGEVK